MPRGSPFTYATGLGLWGLYHRGTLERLPGPESLGGWAFWEVSVGVGVYYMNMYMNEHVCM